MSLVNAQVFVKQDWAKTVNTADHIEDMVVDDDGTIYVVGYEGDAQSFDLLQKKIFVSKYDHLGKREFAYKLNYAPQGPDMGISIKIDSDKNIYVVGVGKNKGSQFSYDFITLKLDNNGNLLWKKIYKPNQKRPSYVHDIALDSLGNVYVTGWGNQEGKDQADIITIKYSSTGKQEWIKFFDQGYDESSKIIIDSKDNIYVLGSSNTNNGNVVLVVKYDYNGNLLWSQSYPGLIEETDLKIDSKDNPILTGNLYDLATFKSDYLIVKYSSTGNLIFENTYDGNDNDRTYNMCIDSKDNAIIHGMSYQGSNNYDYLTTKFDTSGNLAWANLHNNNNGSDYGYSLTIDDEDSVYVSGYTCSKRNSKGYWDNCDFQTVKYDYLGNKIWTSTYSNGFSQSWLVGIDKYQSVYVAGASGSTYENFDSKIVKLVQYEDVLSNSVVNSECPVLNNCYMDKNLEFKKESYVVCVKKNAFKAGLSKQEQKDLILEATNNNVNTAECKFA